MTASQITYCAFIRILTEALFLLTVAAASVSAQSLPRNWVGELQIGERHTLVELNIETSEGGDRGSITYPVSGGKAIPLSALSTAQGRVSFAWPDEGGKMIFEGNVLNGILAGNVRDGIRVGTLQCAPIAHLEHDAEERIVGTYELGPERVLSIMASPVGAVYTDFTSGWSGVLFPSSETEFFGGSAFQVPVPIRIKVKFTVDSQRKVTGIRWQEGNAAEEIGKKLEFKREEVVFNSGDLVLSGTLTLPLGQGPHPAIVRIHGSGPQTRRNSVEGWYAYHGIAYLAFDKRGAGKSTGDWREAGLPELADDVLAAVKFLRQRKEIDDSQISIEAVSEGGWVAPVVATRDPKIKSIIVVVGPALDYVSELMNEVEEGLKARGLEGEDLKKALEFKRQALAMLKNGAGLNDEAWARFQAFLSPYRSEKWFHYVAEPETRSWPQKKLYLMSQLDTVELWRHVTIPVLALYGGKDLNVPAEKNVIALEAALKSAGNRDYTIKVFPDAEHGMSETDKALLTDNERRYLQRNVPGFLSTLLDWVLAHVSVRHQSRQPTKLRVRASSPAPNFFGNSANSLNQDVQRAIAVFSKRLAMGDLTESDLSVSISPY